MMRDDPYFENVEQPFWQDVIGEGGIIGNKTDLGQLSGQESK